MSPTETLPSIPYVWLDPSSATTDCDLFVKSMPRLPRAKTSRRRRTTVKLVDSRASGSSAPV